MLSNSGTNGNHDSQHFAAKHLRESFAANFPISVWGTNLIVGVSGGSDSVALAHLATTLNRETGGQCRICLAHVNHGLRGNESDGDEEFVCKLATSFGADFHSWRVTVSTGNQGSGLESRLRDLRYQLLADLARDRSARCIALAHHSDDQVETVLFRIFRGTSLKGLQGIPHAREIETGISVVRPLIDISRQEILEYLAGQGLSYRTDSSNLLDGPTRNWIRNELLPLLELRFGVAVGDNVARLAKHAGETADLLDSLSSDLLTSCQPKINPHSVEFNAAPLAKSPAAIVRQMLVQVWNNQAWPLRDMSTAKWEELAGWIRAPSTFPDRLMLPGKITARRTEFGTIMLADGQRTSDG